MSTSPPNQRLLRLLATARNHPEFAARVAMQLPHQLRLQFVEELSRPEPIAPKPRPGLKKCAASTRVPNNGMSVQLNLFARSVSRVS
jgi:hypothetical protein